MIGYGVKADLNDGNAAKFQDLDQKLKIAAREFQFPEISKGFGSNVSGR